MSIPMNFICYQCHLRRTVELAAPHASEEALGQLSRELMQMYLDFPRELSSPNLGPKAAVLLEKYAGLKPDRLRPEMDASNRFALERIDDIRARIEKTDTENKKNGTDSKADHLITVKGKSGKHRHEIYDKGDRESGNKCLLDLDP